MTPRPPEEFVRLAREIAMAEGQRSDCRCNGFGPYMCAHHNELADRIASLVAEREAAVWAEAAKIADEHWPESGHVHPDEAVSCQMTISILLRRRAAAIRRERTP